jgi:hypothetical protein
MSTRWLALPFAFLLALPVVSCRAPWAQRTLITYERGTQPFSTIVEEEGTYILYSTRDNRPRFTAVLQPGDELGFREAGTGLVVGVAGPHEIPLHAGETYYWARR